MSPSRLRFYFQTLDPWRTALDPAALLFLAFLSANIRNCLRPSRCIEALELLLYLSRVVTDETVLDRILPYVVYFLNDEAGAVRSMAVRVLTQLVCYRLIFVKPQRN